MNRQPEKLKAKLIARMRDKSEVPKHEKIDEKTFNELYTKLTRLTKSLDHNQPLINVANIYAFVDDYMDKTGVNVSSVCGKQCAHCCKINVDMALIEAIYIREKSDKKLTVVDRDERMHTYTRGNNYCPFLDTNTALCTIYKFRPFACRTFASADHVKYCESGERHHIYSGFKDKNISRLYKYMLNNLSNKKEADIREWFAEFTNDYYESEYAKNLIVIRV